MKPPARLARRPRVPARSRSAPWTLAALLVAAGCPAAGTFVAGAPDGAVDAGNPTDAGAPTDASVPSDAGGIPDSGPGPTGPTVTVRPVEIDDVLYNPGIGFADFHFAWGNPPPPSEYPPSTVAYFRWSWYEVEPAEGQYNFALMDRTISEARGKGETLAFRFMTDYVEGPPRWLLDKGVASIAVDGSVFADHNDPVFLDYHERLLKAFGDRYAGSPDIDHVDIGSVGCWGEWNTACCSGDAVAVCEQYLPTDANQKAITDAYFAHFPGTPLVMLVGGQLSYAVQKGAGWRGDCFGDYGMFGAGWNHMVNVYEPAATDPLVGRAWEKGPVQFEVCGVMQDWYDAGFDIDLILQKGLDWHMSVLNGKSSPVPAPWRSKVDLFLKKLGYRIVLREMTHTSEARAGEPLSFRSRWENVGVAPPYHAWPLAYRLRASSEEVVAQWTSAADPRTWLPGTHEVDDATTLPGAIPAAVYALDVAILTEDRSAAHVHLAVAGARTDRWVQVSQVTILP